MRQPGTPCAVAYRDAFGRATRTYERDGAWVSAATYHALSQEAWDARDLETGGPYAATPSITRVDGHGRTLQTLIENIQPDGSHEVYRLETRYRADNAVVSVTRSEAMSLAPDAPVVTGSGGRARTLTRAFIYDTAGRRIAATDPDTDSRSASRSATNRTWRYLFNRVGDLAAVRDPRGCGDNFYYDVAGRLLGEDYVSCGEAQASGLSAAAEVPAGSIGLDAGDAHAVDARSYYDDAPFFDAAMTRAE
ncbi:MAG: hypothetical protein GXP55_02800, partial [Deltaproteobacteria bacterium]|nr:hypothetical protein [Deltaproteobacteria bacterium]